MSTVFVAPDCHGNIAMLAKLLRQEGILDETMARVPGDVTTVQLGDLINGVSSTLVEDAACLGMAPEWFDHYLVGNHELPYLTNGGPGGFAGWWPDPEIANVLARFRAQGFLRAAYAADDVLITHAGLGPYYKAQTKGETATEIADFLNDVWSENVHHPLFNAVGVARGGRQSEGGILWADWSEPKLRKLNQLIGHTVGDTIRHRNASTCIDLGVGKKSTRIAGAWVRDGEVETVVYDAYKSKEENVEDHDL